MNREERRAALERFERAVELPLLVLALVMVPLIVVPLLTDLPDPVEDAFIAADWFIWAVFAVEYVVRLALTDRRWRFVRREWPDLLIVVLPFLRPLRVVRSARHSGCFGWSAWSACSARSASRAGDSWPGTG